MEKERTISGFEVRAVCPSCGSRRYLRYGQNGSVIYRRCADCGYEGCMIRLHSDEVARIERQR